MRFILRKPYAGWVLFLIFMMGCKGAISSDRAFDLAAQTEPHTDTTFLMQKRSYAEHNDGNRLISEMVTFGTSNALTQWLNEFGTASVDLRSTSAFSLKASSIDLLLPLYHVDRNLIFTQWGLHDSDMPLTANAGIGQRWFFADWMLGYNAFYDVGWHEHHQRYGVGIEGWLDNATLSVNLYQAVTGWRHSHRQVGYDEKPADGWDVRLEGWVPQWPSLGGRFVYEQYYGEQATLTSFSQRGKNPYATTLGLRYSPMPLFTAGIDRKQQRAHSPDTFFNINLTWRVGLNLEQQLRTDNHLKQHYYANNQLELVSRNNTLVMDYRRQDILSLRFPDEIHAGPATEFTFVPVIMAKRGVAKVELDDTALVAAGGKVINVSDKSITILLPAIPGEAIKLYGTAIDSDGNRSNRAQTLVYAVAENSNMTVEPDKTLALADGKDEIAYTATLIRADGKSSSEIPVTWQTDTGELSVHSVLTDSAGKARVRLRSHVPGSAHVVATADQQSVSAPEVNFVHRNEYRIALEANQTSVAASGYSFDNVTFRAKITTKDGSPVAGETIFWASNLGILSAASAVTDHEGVATVSLVSDKPGMAHVTASIASGESAQQHVNFYEYLVLFLQGRHCAQANGNDAVTLTLSVNNKNHQPLAGEVVEWSTSLGSLSAYSTDTGPDGKSTVTLTSQHPGAARVIANVHGNIMTHGMTFIEEATENCM